MKLSDWASIAEIVGGFAIVITLIVLIFEVRANTDATEAATRQSIAARTEAIALAAATAPSLARAIENPNGIERGTQEYRQLGLFHTALLRHTEEAYLQWQDGRLDEGYFSRRAVAAFSGMDSELFRARFDQVRERYDPGYVDWVYENILDRPIQ